MSYISFFEKELPYFKEAYPFLFNNGNDNGDFVITEDDIEDIKVALMLCQKMGKSEGNVICCLISKYHEESSDLFTKWVKQGRSLYSDIAIDIVKITKLYSISTWDILDKMDLIKEKPIWKILNRDNPIKAILLFWLCYKAIKFEILTTINDAWSPSSDLWEKSPREGVYFSKRDNRLTYSTKENKYYHLYGSYHVYPSTDFSFWMIKNERAEVDFPFSSSSSKIIYFTDDSFIKQIYSNQDKWLIEQFFNKYAELKGFYTHDLCRIAKAIFLNEFCTKNGNTLLPKSSSLDMFYKLRNFKDNRKALSVVFGEKPVPKEFQENIYKIHQLICYLTTLTEGCSIINTEDMIECVSSGYHFKIHMVPVFILNKDESDYIPLLYKGVEQCYMFLPEPDNFTSYAPEKGFCLEEGNKIKYLKWCDDKSVHLIHPTIEDKGNMCMCGHARG